MGLVDLVHLASRAGDDVLCEVECSRVGLDRRVLVAHPSGRGVLVLVPGLVRTGSCLGFLVWSSRSVLKVDLGVSAAFVAASKPSSAYLGRETG